MTKFHLLQFFAQRAHYFLAITRNQDGYSDPQADKYVFFYARFASWMTLPAVLFICYLDRFLVPELANTCQKVILYFLFPASVFAVWLSYRGERKHLLQAQVLFEAASAIAWCISVTASAKYPEGMNYYLFLPVFCPIVAGSMVTFSLYPKQMAISHLLFFSTITVYPLMVDPNALTQIPSFINFVAIVVLTSIFVFTVSNVTAVLYESIAEKEEKQTTLSQVQTILDNGLDAAPFGLLCYKNNGELILSRGVSSYFPNNEEIKTQECLNRFLEAECKLDIKAINGTVAQIKIADNPVMVSRKSAGSITVYSFVDMTERHDWEERALTAQKMGLVGQITSGITHDYNNSLAVAISSIERVPRDGNNEIWEEHLDLAFNALDQARHISKKLMAMSGSRTLNFEEIDVDKSIEAMLPLLRSVVPDHIYVQAHSSVGVNIVTDPGEFEAALLNLVINSKSAIGANPGSIVLNTRIENDVVTASVRDNGPGVPDNILEQVFDPFFSTHKGRSSSGMGLTTVKSFVEGSNGSVNLKSEPGNTVFELKFPTDPEKMPSVSETILSQAESYEAPQVETIMLIDDNVPLLEVMAELVELQGVKCHVAGNANEARKKIKEIPDIDAVFIDLSMPDINGIDLGEELIQNHPDCRYYLLTGERLTEKTQKAKELGFRGIFFKPLKVGELLEAAVT